MPRALPRWALPALCLTLATAPARAALPRVPDGFEVRLVASVPAVHYPTQVIVAPDGALYVAEDPMDQVGPYEADHGRIRVFRDGQEPSIFAEGLRAVFGMAWRGNDLYVMHMPYLSIFRDTDGDGKADRRDDLFKDLGPGPRPGALNDHIVSGLQFGMDGWLYIAVGDKGIPGATRPEDGVKVQLKGGGIVRCRPDGTQLEVYSRGTRNHLEPNLDAADGLFTYDNTDDGDGWWTRVTHHIYSGYYGYPYDYHDRPDRMLPRMAEYGGGSPCGAILYKEDAWPEAWRGVGFWAEWGKGKVHAFRFAPDGSTFKVAEAIDFAVPNGVDNFRPIDLALSPDGTTLYVADWGMGGWGSKTEKVGRVFAITFTGDVTRQPRGNDSDPVADQIRALSHPAFGERMRAQNALIADGRDALGLITAALANPQTPPLARRHLVWALDGVAGATPEASLPLIEALKDPEADVRAQAARALGQRRVPIALEALVALLQDPEPTVRLQAVIALNRIGDAGAIPALLPVLASEDEFLAFAARQALRAIGAWDVAAGGLSSENPKVRAGLLLAMEQQYDVDAARALAAYALGQGHPEDERARALEYLATVHRKAKPWDGRWWGTRPSGGGPPPKVDAWEGTELVLGAIREGLTDPDAPVRIAAVEAVLVAGDRDALPILRERFPAEPDPVARTQMALALGRLDDKAALPLLVAALRDPKAPDTVREASLSSLEALGADVAATVLVDLLGQPDLPAERRARVLKALGAFKAEPAIPAILATLDSPEPPVRAEAARALGAIGRAEGVAEHLRPRLDDPELDVRKAAIQALGDLRDRESVPPLIALAGQPETRFEATIALAAFPDTRALQVFLAGLADKSPDVRKASSVALAAIRDQAGPMIERLHERAELSPSLLPELRKVFAGLQPIAEWRILGPFGSDADVPLAPEGPIDLNASFTGLADQPITWRLEGAVDEHGKVDLDRLFGGGDRKAYGYAEIQAPAARRAEMVVGSDDTLRVWLNGRQVYDFQNDRGFNPEQDRLEVDLAEGTNRLLVACGNRGGPWAFSVAVTAPEEYAFLNGPAPDAFNPDTYRDFALKNSGNPDHGRALFADLQGLACVKCHAVSGQGGTVGPDLTGVGAKYPREELIRSVLYPSAQIFSGYEPVVVATADGRVLTGILKGETPEGLVIEDAEAKRITIPADDIDARKTSDVSLMPNGLAEGLTPADFADLISYLESLKEPPPTPAAGGR